MNTLTQTLLVLIPLLFSGSLAAGEPDAAPPTPLDETFRATAGVAMPAAVPATRRVSVPDLPYEAQVASGETAGTHNELGTRKPRRQFDANVLRCGDQGFAAVAYGDEFRACIMRISRTQWS